jgi:RimJ/RimL family protein N-acetyltransferase
MKYKLRDWQPTDLKSLIEHANNPYIAKWLTNQFPHPYSESDGVAFIESVANNHTAKVFAIDVDGEAVGSIGIFPQSDIHEKNAEIGYWLSETFWGNGIISQAIKDISDYGFKTFDIVRLFARPFATNVGSQKALEKAGFVLEARLKKAIYKNGEYIDELIYSKCKKDE